jgi:hypothetical protein
MANGAAWPEMCSWLFRYGKRTDRLSAHKRFCFLKVPVPSWPLNLYLKTGRVPHVRLGVRGPKTMGEALPQFLFRRTLRQVQQKHSKKFAFGLGTFGRHGTRPRGSVFCCLREFFLSLWTLLCIRARLLVGPRRSSKIWAFRDCVRTRK